MRGKRENNSAAKPFKSVALQFVALSLLALTLGPHLSQALFGVALFLAVKQLWATYLSR